MEIIDISRTLDEKTAVFPGDHSFSRKLTMSMLRGDSVNVSVVSGSSHAGTHVDFPFHFTNNHTDVDLETFVGPAWVIEVKDWEDIYDIQIEPNYRVLFKTKNSFCDYRLFDENFYCMTKGVVEWLVRQKVILVGVDGPSVDPVDSKDLENHRALYQAGITILENLDLTLASGGQYQLIALPIKLANADASWVRAVLIK